MQNQIVEETWEGHLPPLHPPCYDPYGGLVTQLLLGCMHWQRELIPSQVACFITKGL